MNVAQKQGGSRVAAARLPDRNYRTPAPRDV